MKKYLTLLLLPVLLFSCKDEKKMPSSYMIICSNGVCDTISVGDSVEMNYFKDSSIGWHKEQSQVCDTLYADTLANGHYFDKLGNIYDSNGVLITKIKYE